MTPKTVFLASGQESRTTVNITEVHNHKLVINKVLFNKWGMPHKYSDNYGDVHDPLEPFTRAVFNGL